MNFEIQNALGGKVIASRSDLTRLRNAMTLACEDDEEDDDEDDITLADLKEQLEDNMTLAEIQKELVKVEAAKKRLETIRLKKEKKEEEEEEVREWVDEATFAARSRDNMPNF